VPLTPRRTFLPRATALPPFQLDPPWLPPTASLRPRAARRWIYLPVVILEDARTTRCWNLRQGLVWRPPWFGSVGRSAVANPARRRRGLEIRRRSSFSEKAVGGYLFCYPFPELSPHLPCSSRSTVHGVLFVLTGV
jgi:hypothetical protein